MIEQPRRTGIAQVMTADRALASLLVGATAFLVYAWWAQHPPGLMSVDEAASALLALRDWRALERGLDGLAGALTSSASAPLVPLVASPFTATDPMSTATVLAHIPFMWLLIISAYSTYRQITGPRAALVGTVVTALLPGILTYSRSLHFAVPVTAVLTASLAALLASRNLTSWRWSLAFGALLGLAPLTRTIAVALVPGLLLAAVVLAVRLTPARVWVRNLALAVTTGALVAGSWYLPSFPAVFDYLIGQGLTEGSAFNVDSAPWLLRMRQVVGQDFLIPLTVIGLAVVIVALARCRFSSGGRAVAAVAVAVGWYFLALSTSRSGGTAFTLPLAPLLVALVLHFATRLSPRQAAVAGAAAVALTAFNVTAAAIPLGRMGFDDIAIMDGRSATDAQLAQALGTPDTTVSDPVSLGSALRQMNCSIAARREDGAILLTRPDALVSGILHCAEALYREQPLMASPGCSPTDRACVADVVGSGGYPTVITGEARASYPGAFAEEIVLPALTDYRLVNEFELAPGVVVRVWAR